MITFNLPDLGEGLPEAEIVSWHVTEGTRIEQDQPLLSVETAKAVVEVPSPYSATVTRLHAKPGDTVQTGGALVDFDLPDEPVSAGENPAPETHQPSGSEGMVVGHMATSDTELVDRAIIGRSNRRVSGDRVRAAPAVRMLAKRLGIDLASCNAGGRHGLIRIDDVLARANAGGGSAAPSVPGITDDDRLRGTRKAMSASMSVSRDQIAMCTVFDDADIHSWYGRADVTTRIIRAIVAGAKAEPSLNALYDANVPARRIIDKVHLAIAVDSNGGLIVPVLRDVGAQSPGQLRASLNDLKERVRNRTVTVDEMRDYTFTLSNFGTMAGRYATPLVTPPTVAILGVGKVQRDVVAGATAAEIHMRLPLSLTFDHRCSTGGEACRFLGAVMADLALPA